jgi:2-oxoglutarate ferredoxin oxidoreductase subunit beta
MGKVFGKPESMTEKPFSYCSGCGHSLVHRLIAELIDEMGLAPRTIGVAPVGCAVTAYDYFRFDFCESAHGRAAAVATGIKRARPDKFVFTYQGDGDLAAIGLAETIHAANRGEKITVVFINNSVYGMTGGQMAPTTLPGQKTTTSPYGRDVDKEGYPIRAAEMIATLDAPAYVVRSSVSTAAGINRTKKHLKTAFQLQVDGKGYSFVEILSQCPTNLGLTPLETNAWLDGELTKRFPLGIYKDRFQAG